MSSIEPTEPHRAGAYLDPGTVRDLAALLTTLDEFLRNDGVRHNLASFLATRGHTHPGYDAATVLDAVSFAAHRLRA